MHELIAGPFFEDHLVLRPASPVGLKVSPRRYRELAQATPNDDRVLTEHVDDGTGRCTACPHSGPAEWQRWPCRLHSLATLAGETLAAGPGEHRTGSTR